MKKNIICLLIIFICSYAVTLAQCPPNSGPTTACPEGREYPYKVCVNGQIKTECLSNPNARNGIIKMNLPICITVKEGYTFVAIGVYDSEEAPGKGVELTGRANTQRDFTLAANKWNCICGYNSDNGCGTNINAIVSQDFKKFKDPYNDLSNANVADGDACFPSDQTIYLNASDADGDACFPSDQTIYLNASDEFMYAKPSKDNPDKTLPEKPRSKFLVNDEVIMNKDMFNRVQVALTYNTPGLTVLHSVYNMVDVAIKQIGEILGMSWSPDCNNCTGSIMGPNGIDRSNWGGDITPPYHGLGGPDNLSYGDCDKCMFKNLYCPEESIYEYEPQTQKVYPNPGYHVISIDFTLPDYCENVRMYIQNPLGQVVLVPIENIAFEGGDHTELINVDSLLTGTYYVIIEADLYRTAKPIVIINE